MKARRSALRDAVLLQPFGELGGKWVCSAGSLSAQLRPPKGTEAAGWLQRTVRWWCATALSVFPCKSW